MLKNTNARVHILFLFLILCLRCHVHFTPHRASQIGLTTFQAPCSHTRLVANAWPLVGGGHAWLYDGHTDSGIEPAVSLTFQPAG